MKCKFVNMVNITFNTKKWTKLNYNKKRFIEGNLFGNWKLKIFLDLGVKYKAH